MRKSFDLRAAARTATLALCLVFACSLASPALRAQNNANSGAATTQSTNSTTTRTTTATSQTAPAGQTTVETRRETAPSPLLWIVIVAVIALLAIAFIAMRKRGSRDA